jgi:hypothetical protein
MKCPGQDMKYWKADAIFNARCPQCSATVEFYMDDTSRKCSSCGHRFVNPKMDFGCASYCQYAAQCLGTLPEEFNGAQDTFLKEKVAIEMKRFFQTDFKSIRRAMTTARFAEDISKTEGGNPAIVLCAAYLYDTGTTAATAILKRVGAGEQMIEEICALLDPAESLLATESLPKKILHDALTLRQMQESLQEAQDDWSTKIQNGLTILSTNTAKGIATSFAP